MNQKHHYVSKFYLSNWAADDGKSLWVHRRIGHTGELESRQRSTNATAYEHNLYKLESCELNPIVGASPFSVEKSQSRMETKYADCLRRICEGSLSEEDKTLWADYIYFQLGRTPDKVHGRIQFSDDIYEDFLSNSAPQLESNSRELRRCFPSEEARNIARSLHIAPIKAKKDWVKWLPEWEWFFCRVTGYFVTSDKPILLNTLGARPGETIFTVSMPLSPDFALICIPPAWKPDVEWFKYMVVTLNARLVSLRPQCIYSNQPLDRLPGPNLRGVINHYLTPSDS